MQKNLRKIINQNHVTCSFMQIWQLYAKRYQYCIACIQSQDTTDIISTHTLDNLSCGYIYNFTSRLVINFTKDTVITTV